MKNKAYDILKWIAIIALPATAWLVGGIGGELGWTNAQTATNVINMIATFLGALIGVSSYNYNRTGDDRNDDF